MSTLGQLVRYPTAAVEFANILLTQNDAVIGATPKDVVWTHRKTTLYRYRSTQRRHALPVLLVFALINRPDIFDLRPGNSYVEFLLEEGFDVFLIDWGVPGDEDSDMGLDSYVCDELAWGIRETLRTAGQEELSLVGWCIGGTLCAMHASIEADSPARNLVLLTTPIDTTRLALRQVGGPRLVRRRPGRRGAAGHPGRPDRLGEQDDEAGDELLDDLPARCGTACWRATAAARPTSRWPAGSATTRRSPAAPTASGSPGCTRRTAWSPAACACAAAASTWGRSSRTCSSSPPAPTTSRRGSGTLPLLDLVGSEDVTHLDRPGGHIGLMAGSKSRREIWPEIAEWLAERSDQ